MPRAPSRRRAGQGQGRPHPISDNQSTPEMTTQHPAPELSRRAASRASAGAGPAIRHASLRGVGLILALMLPATWAGAAVPPGATGPPRVHRALLVSIDGLRPDVLLRAQAPVLRGLMDRGSFTMWAQTTPAAVTLPSHVSMLTGVSPSRHGIEWNTDLPLARPVYPASPTLFEVAHAAGLSTAMAAGKTKFSVLVKPGTLDWWCVPSASTLSDSAVTDTAAGWIAARRPQVLFVHLPDVDLTGHALGWGSPGQLAAVASADRCVGRLLAALARAGLRDSTVILVTADHGGAGRSHGPDDPRSRFVPWIVAGPGVRENVDLTRFAELGIRTEDTFATLCRLLGLAVSGPLDGRPVSRILVDSGAAAESSLAPSQTP